jgi:transcriptional regulator with XRE-family HTH domain
MPEDAPVTTPLGYRFGRNVRNARRSLGISQEELARRCGIHPTHISKVERGGSVPGVEVMFKIIGVLGVDANAICAGIAFNPDKGVIEVDQEPES